MARIGLVLGAGGATGHAFHIGVLSALEEATGWDPRTADVIVGTSAGALIAALLRGGMAPRDLAARALGEALSPEGAEIASILGRPEPPPASEPSGLWSILSAAEPSHLLRLVRRPWDTRVGAVIAAALPAGRVPTDHLVGGIGRVFGSEWPARALWINAVRLADGQRVTFGHRDAPAATVAEAVAASCAIPAYYRPVEIDGVRYADGGAHSPTNADLLAGHGLDLVLVSSPMSAGFDVFRPAPDGAFRGYCRLLLRREMSAVRMTGTSILALEPGRVDRALMGVDPLNGERRHGIIRQARTSVLDRFADPVRRERLRVLTGAAPNNGTVGIVGIVRDGRPVSRVAELGVPVHYMDYGGSGPAMVLIHGLGGAHVNWMAVGEKLARHARVVAIDLPGFGRTPTEGDSSSIHANRALLTRFVERVMGEPAILVGNSMGGLISLITAADSPASVTGLVLVNPALPPAAGAFFDLGVAAIFAGYCLPGIGELLMTGRKALLGSEGSVRQMLDFCCVDSGRVPEDVVAATIALSQERIKANGGNAAFLSAARSIVACIMQRGNFERMVARIRVPALLVHGTHDRLVPLAAARQLAAARPDWTLKVFENIGHVPQLEDPDGFVAAVESWLQHVGEAVLARTAS